jgi:hypothetical protein
MGETVLKLHLIELKKELRTLVAMMAEPWVMGSKPNPNSTERP